jgi:hypothetical protein
VGERICTIEDCENLTGIPGTARGLCRKHYDCWARHGDPLWESAPRLCSIEGCDRKHFGRGWCRKHHRAWWMYGDPLANKTRPLAVPRTCSVEGCDRDETVKRLQLCGTHYARWKSTGDPLGLRERRGGSRHVFVGNDAAHFRVIHDRGRASTHQCVDCGQVAAHWSYDNADPNELPSKDGTYSLDVWHYQPRCARCHKRFDVAFAKAARTA